MSIRGDEKITIRKYSWKDKGIPTSYCDTHRVLGCFFMLGVYTRITHRMTQDSVDTRVGETKKIIPHVCAFCLSNKRLRKSKSRGEGGLRVTINISARAGGWTGIFRTAESRLTEEEGGSYEYHSASFYRFLSLSWRRAACAGRFQQLAQVGWRCGRVAQVSFETWEFIPWPPPPPHPPFPYLAPL